MDLSTEKGASNWLTVLPVEEFGFSLHKGAFRDALALRYGWQLSNIPQTCSCGSNFTVEHMLSCAKGGYPSIRHNEIRDFTAHLMTEVCRLGKKLTTPETQTLHPSIYIYIVSCPDPTHSHQEKGLFEQILG